MIKQIAAEIKTIRKGLGLKQREIAAKLNMNQFTYANYEVGRTMPPADVYLKIKALAPSDSHPG